MPAPYHHLQLPRRGPLYVAIGVWLILMYTVAAVTGSPLVIAAICLSLTAAAWSVTREPAAGMEIDGPNWTIFVGERRWTIPLNQIAAVRVLGSRERPEGLALQLRNGKTSVLPSVLSPRIPPLAHALARRGIPLQA